MGEGLSGRGLSGRGAKWERASVFTSSAARSAPVTSARQRSTPARGFALSDGSAPPPRESVVAAWRCRLPRGRLHAMCHGAGLCAALPDLTLSHLALPRSVFSHLLRRQFCFRAGTAKRPASRSKLAGSRRWRRRASHLARSSLAPLPLIPVPTDRAPPPQQVSHVALSLLALSLLALSHLARSHAGPFPLKAVPT